MRAPSVPSFALAAALACAPSQPTPADLPPTPAPTPAAGQAPREPVEIVVLGQGKGRGAAAVEREITAPLEQALAGVPGVTAMRSVSRDGAASIVLSLAASAEPGAAQTAARARLDAATSSLPRDVTTTITTQPGPQLLQFVLSGDDTALRLRALAGPLRDALAATSGVGRVELCGGREPALQVTVDPARMTAYALSLAEITRALTQDLNPLPVEGLRVVARRPEDLAALVVKPGEAQVRLGDVARVELAGTLPACDAARIGGGAVVIGTVLAQRGIAGEAATAELTERLATLRASLPAGVRLEVPGPTRRVALELLAGAAPGESVAQAAALLAPALAAVAPRAAYVRAVVPVNPGAPVELELLLERVDAAESAALVQALAAIPGVRVRASDGDVEALTRGVVIGDELDVAARLADELAGLARKQPGVRSASARTGRVPELVVEVQRERLAAVGLAEADLRGAMAAAMVGVEVGSITQDGAQVPVRVQLGESLTSPQELAALRMTTASGSVPLSELVTLRLDEQPDAITRVDRRRAVEVELELAGPEARAAVERAAAAELRLPAGYVLRFE